MKIDAMASRILRVWMNKYVKHSWLTIPSNSEIISSLGSVIYSCISMVWRLFFILATSCFCYKVSTIINPPSLLLLLKIGKRVDLLNFPVVSFADCASLSSVISERWVFASLEFAPVPPPALGRSAEGHAVCPLCTGNSKTELLNTVFEMLYLSHPQVHKYTCFSVLQSMILKRWELGLGI